MEKIFNKDHYLLITILFLLIITSLSSKATHIAAVDLSYSYTGNLNEYEITLKMYRDCMGQYAEDSIPMCIKSDICNFLPSNVNHFYIYKEPGRRFIEYPKCIPVTINNTYCGAAIGMKYGIEEHIYKTKVILAQQCPDWQFQFGYCCRNGNITTITSGAFTNIFVDALLNNLAVPNNNSPVFGQDPVTMWCVNNPFVFDHKAVDPDGDSLAFELVPALSQSLNCYFNNPVDTVNYIAPYSGSNPFATVSGTFVDPVTGIISFTPTMVQTGILDILVKEYRNGVLVGTTRRDIQIHITDNCNLVPQFITSTVNGLPDAIKAYCGDTSIILAINMPVKCPTLAPDASDFIAFNDAGQQIFIDTIEIIRCDTLFADSLKITFNNPLQGGTSKIVLIKGTDNNTLSGKCQSDMIANDTVNIVVLTELNVNLGSDTAICTGDTIVLEASSAGATSVLWHDNSINQTFIADQPGLYFVKVTKGVCTASDTILIEKDTLSVAITGESFICKGDTVFLTAKGDKIQNYLWHNGITDSVIEGTAAGYYSIKVSAGSCTATDTFFLKDESVIVTLGNDTIICEGEVVTLFASGNNISGYLWHDGTNDPELATGIAGIYYITAFNSYCESTDTAVVSIKDCSVSKSCNIAVPNAFTPDNNGLNDYFGIINNCEFTFFNMKIYNRWGNLLYETNDAGSGWDGYFKNEIQGNGVYTYIIEYEIFSSSVRETKKGNFTLLY